MGKKVEDWRDVENDNLLNLDDYADLTDEELDKLVKDGLAQLDKEIAEGKRDKD